jgi:hypothetical protein
MENNTNFDNLPNDFNVDMGIDWYIDEIVKQKPDFNDLDEEVLDQIKKDLKPRVESHINIEILKNIPQNKLEEFEKIVNSNNQEEIQAFCNENIPDLKDVIAMALISFRDSYMGDNY